MTTEVRSIEDTKSGLLAQKIQNAMNEGFYPMGAPIMKGSQFIVFVSRTTDQLPVSEETESAEPAVDPDLDLDSEETDT